MDFRFGRQLPVVTVGESFGSATCYALADGRVRPEADGHKYF